MGLWNTTPKSSRTTFVAMVFCAKFSADGKYLEVAVAILAERFATVVLREAAMAPSAIYTVSAQTTAISLLGEAKVRYILTFSECAHLIEVFQIWETGRRRVCARFKH
jgi:hypothetical protein